MNFNPLTRLELQENFYVCVSRATFLDGDGFLFFFFLIVTVFESVIQIIQSFTGTEICQHFV